MSRDVEKAYEAYPYTEENHFNHEWNAKRVGFQQGYKQAEKDSELTVDDIMTIDALLIEMWNQSENKYQEVLKRFKNLKHVK